MPRKNITSAEEKCLRQLRIHLLSRRPCRWLRADSGFEAPHEISRTAYKVRPTPRTAYLAKHKEESPEFAENFGPVLKEKSWYRKAAVLSQRQVQLAQPRKYVETDEQIETKGFESREQWLAYQKKLKTFAAPKRIPSSPTDPIRAKTPLKDILPRLKELAKPARRPPNTVEWTHEELYTIKSSVLKYKPTERIIKLATPKPLRDEALMDLNWSSEERMRFLKSKDYVASKRILELATPQAKNLGIMGESKADPYAVSQKALTYRATARIKKLAMPRVRQ